MTYLVDPGVPLASDEGVPVLYGALGAIFQLESLGAEDEERLDQANEIVWDWIGSKLRFTTFSSPHPVRRAARADLEYISAYASGLGAPERTAGASDGERTLALDLGRAFVDDFGIVCSGADTPASASPYSCAFWSEIPEAADEPTFRTCAVLQVTVPIEWPLDDFFARVTNIARCLRLRWGAAGHMYSLGGTVENLALVRNKMRAHARRYVGYDTGYYLRLVEAWHEQIRTVNWLTFLGPALQSKLAASGRVLATSSLVEVSPCAGHVMLRAGERPEAGDQNRLDFPRSYVEADAMVRPVRAREGIHFGDPWTEATTTEWLCRFERRVT